MIFRKWGGGGIKGRLELFQKIITFGDAILPLATLENANIEVLHLRSWGEFLVFTKTNSLLSLNTSKHLRTCMTIKWVFRPVRISTMLHPSWMTFSYTAETCFRIRLAYFEQSPCPGKTQTRTVGFNFENVAELARREFLFYTITFQPPWEEADIAMGEMSREISWNISNISPSPEISRECEICTISARQWNRVAGG